MNLVVKAIWLYWPEKELESVLSWSPDHERYLTVRSQVNSGGSITALGNNQLVIQEYCGGLRDQWDCIILMR